MKHDWQTLKRTYMYDEKYKNTSLRKFAEKEELAYDGNYIAQTKNWHSERKQKQMQIGCKTDAKIEKKIIEETAKIAERYSKIYDALLSKIENQLEETYMSYAYDHEKGKNMPAGLRTKIVKPQDIKALAQAISLARQGYSETIS